MKYAMWSSLNNYVCLLDKSNFTVAFTSQSSLNMWEIYIIDTNFKPVTSSLDFGFVYQGSYNELEDAQKAMKISVEKLGWRVLDDKLMNFI